MVLEDQAEINSSRMENLTQYLQSRVKPSRNQ